MSEHPLAILGGAIRHDGGYVMEFWPRRPMRGGLVRVWVPTYGSAERVVIAAARLGLSPGDPMGHLEGPGSVEYEGYQVVIRLPPQMELSVTAMLALDAPSREINESNDP